MSPKMIQGTLRPHISEDSRDISEEMTSRGIKKKPVTDLGQGPGGRHQYKALSMTFSVYYIHT